MRRLWKSHLAICLSLALILAALPLLYWSLGAIAAIALIAWRWRVNRVANGKGEEKKSRKRKPKKRKSGDLSKIKLLPTTV